MTIAPRLQPLLAEWSAELCVPGAAVGVVHGGTSEALSVGVTSVDTRLPVDDRTLFHIGSTTKTFTATAFLQLVAVGQADLDTPVSSYLPELRLSDPHALRTLTPRHLLTHSGGFLGDIEDGEDWGPDALARSLEVYPHLPQLFAPGQLASYSNAGFRLLGLLVQVLAGAPYEDVVTRSVLEPLAMSDSVFFPWEAFSRPHAVGHVSTEAGTAVAHTYGIFRDGNPEGGLLSSVRDQIRWLELHLGFAGHIILSSTMRSLMQEPRTEIGPPLGRVGMPWLIQDRDGVRLVSHGGNIANVLFSTFTMVPERGFGVTVLTNAPGGRELGRRVREWCLSDLLDVRPEPALLPDAEDGRALAESCAGSYDAGLWQLVVTSDDGTLSVRTELSAEAVAQGVQPVPPMRLSVTADGALVPFGGGSAVGRLLQDASGEIRFLHLGGRAVRRVG